MIFVVSYVKISRN